MSECPSSLVPDMQLAQTLRALEVKEERERQLEQEMIDLKRSLKEKDSKYREARRQSHALQKEKEQLTVSMGELRERVEKLESSHTELSRVNKQWDLEYSEQTEAFRRYRFDAQLAQTEMQELIAKLKAEKEDLARLVQDDRHRYDRLTQENVALQQRLRSLEEAGQPGLSLRAHEEHSAMLRQQLKAFQEDFEAERRDRERLADEKQSAALRYEAEVTSLKLQLDRCKNELTHATTDVHRLRQQLTLKSQYEEEQYRNHLHKKGYVPRSPLPPLDPYVELDQQDVALGTGSHSDSALYLRHAPPASTAAPSAQASVALHRPSGGVARVMLARSAPSTATHPTSPPSPPHTSAPPPPTHTLCSVTPPTSSYVANGYSYAPAVNSFTSAANAAPSPVLKGYTPPIPNAHGPSPVPNSPSPIPNGQAPIAGHTEVRLSAIPPLRTEGRFKCPRCGRRFATSEECDGHKLRCMS